MGNRSSAPLSIKVTIDDERALGGIKAARRNIDRGVHTGLKRGVELFGLPTARRLVPRHTAQSLTAGATTRTAYLQLTKIRGDELLNEFGGTRRDVLVPKTAHALKTPFGPRAAVRGPRHYKGRHDLKKTVEQTREPVLREAERAISEEIGKHLEMS